jgi:(p)ppGpp synthase/HD superfamily hydrolase
MHKTWQQQEENNVLSSSNESTDGNSIRLGAKQYAIKCHESTNHKYDNKPYSVHLQMVVDAAEKYIHHIYDFHRDMVVAACWLHDVIEDCRKTYNDIRKDFSGDVAEIVYAVTNEKGRTRKDRANEKYYEGIKATPYAVFVKVCDRLANVRYSVENNSNMVSAYRKEFKEFEEALNDGTYKEMFWEIAELLNKEQEDNRSVARDDDSSTAPDQQKSDNPNT